MSSERLGERTRWFGWVWLLAFAGACADLERGSAPPEAGASAPANDASASDAGAGNDDVVSKVSFTASVHHLMTDGCARCHSMTGEARNTTLVLSGDAARDHQQVVKFVNSDNPAASRILAKSAGMGHGGGAIYASSTPEYRTILDWITQGSSP